MTLAKDETGEPGQGKKLVPQKTNTYVVQGIHFGVVARGNNYSFVVPRSKVSVHYFPKGATFAWMIKKHRKARLIINGTFFGGDVTLGDLISVPNKVRSFHTGETRLRKKPAFYLPFGNRAYFGITRKDEPVIGRGRAKKHAYDRDAFHVLIGGLGPLLEQGKYTSLVSRDVSLERSKPTGCFTNQHLGNKCRIGIGITTGGKILVVLLSGTVELLAKVMKGYGVLDAVFTDAGGSTKMYLNHDKCRRKEYQAYDKGRLITSWLVVE